MQVVADHVVHYDSFASWRAVERSFVLFMNISVSGYLVAFAPKVQEFPFSVINLAIVWRFTYRNEWMMNPWLSTKCFVGFTNSWALNVQGRGTERLIGVQRTLYVQLLLAKATFGVSRCKVMLYKLMCKNSWMGKICCSHKKPLICSLAVLSGKGGP